MSIVLLWTINKKSFYAKLAKVVSKKYVEISEPRIFWFDLILFNFLWHQKEKVCENPFLYNFVSWKQESLLCTIILISNHSLWRSKQTLQCTVTGNKGCGYINSLWANDFSFNGRVKFIFFGSFIDRIKKHSLALIIHQNVKCSLLNFLIIVFTLNLFQHFEIFEKR